MRVILDRPDLAPAELLTSDRRVAAALSLAEAEVRLVSAKSALNEFENGDTQLHEAAGMMRQAQALLLSAIADKTVTKKAVQEDLSLARRIAAIMMSDVRHGGREHVLLKRYLREARGRRRRAFETWIECIGQSDGAAQAAA